jgi:hypothetical protein
MPEAGERSKAAPGAPSKNERWMNARFSPGSAPKRHNADTILFHVIAIG